MKKNFHTTTLPCLVVILGAANAGIRYWMYTAAVDEKGLLLRWSPPGILCLSLSAVTALLILGAVLTGKGSDRYGENFPPSLLGGICACLLAAAIGWSCLGSFQTLDTLGKLRMVVGWASVPCLLLTAYGRIRGVRPIFLLHGIVCLFFGLNLADHYRIWSAEPQMADYIFQLLSAVGLLLTAYHRTAFDVGLGGRKGLQSASLLAGFFCFSAVTASQEAVFYLAGGLWCLGSLFGAGRRRKAGAT